MEKESINLCNERDVKSGVNIFIKEFKFFRIISKRSVKSVMNERNLLA